MPVSLIKHRGFFNYADLLHAVRGWFVQDDFEVINMPLYLLKFPEPTGTEHEFKIVAEKTVTEYVKFHFTVEMRVYNMRDIEVIHEGQKVKLQDGQMQITIIPELELDWQKRFSGSGPFKGFLSALDKFYRGYIIKYKISDYWEDMILLKSSQLAHLIKSTMGQEVI